MTIVNTLKPYMNYTFTVKKPAGDVPIRERLAWTMGAVAIFLVCCQVPLFGIRVQEGGDPFHWMRMLMASNRGSLMELGITPIVTSSMIVQLLTSARVINIDTSRPEGKEMMVAVQKILGFAIALFQSTAYVASGMYGSVAVLGLFRSIMLIAQLTFAGVLVVLMDEILSKGYGIGSGISLFIATSISQNIMWQTLSFRTVNAGRGEEVEGALMALLSLLFNRASKLKALREAFYRSHLTNLVNVFSTFLVFLVVVYLQGFKIEVPIVHEAAKVRRNYPIKLFYTSTTPIILQGALTTNLYFVSQVLFRATKETFLAPIVALLGAWEESGPYGRPMPVSGLIYYVSPPKNLAAVAANPWHALCYVSFMLITCTVFSMMWVHLSGSSPNDVARELQRNGFTIARVERKNIEKELSRYILPAAAIGGFLVGGLTVAADFLGAIGSGTGILLVVSAVYGILEAVNKSPEVINAQGDVMRALTQ